jgi:DNA topoisomerase-1
MANEMLPAVNINLEEEKKKAYSIDPSKFKAWNTLSQKARDAGMSTEMRKPELFNLQDVVEGKLKLAVGDKIAKGVDWIGKNVDTSLLPPPPPPKSYVPGVNTQTGEVLTPAEIGMRTFLDETSTRLYDKILRPLTTPKNIAIAGTMAVAPQAAIPYLSVGMVAPMAADGYKKVAAAYEEKDPAKRMEMMSDAAINIGMATIIGAKGGSELIKKVGEVPVVNAVKEHIANSRLMTDESGYISTDFLKTLNKIKDVKTKVELPKTELGLKTAPKTKAYDVMPARAHYDMATKKWFDIDDNPFPDHLQSVRRDLTEMKYDPNPDANIWAIGRDSKNRSQYVFNPKYTKSNQAANFSNVAEMNEQIGGMIKAMKKDSRSGVNRDEASIMRLINETGIRIGGKKTLADKQSYGATTLLGKHVVGDSLKDVRLQFTGKFGKDWDVPIKDMDMAQDLLNRKNIAGPDGKIFNTTAPKVRAYSKSLGTGDFTPKDYRTFTGTDAAISTMKNMTVPQNASQYKKSVAIVGDAVAKRLNNTRSVAIQSYINPSVWAEWKAASKIDIKK